MILKKKHRPFVDHIGLDLRKEDDKTRKIFDSAVKKANSNNIRTSHQGGEGKNVFCCHTQVKEKSWMFNDNEEFFPIIEIAYGPLIIEEGKSGCDLRPMDPGIKLKDESKACCG